MTQAEFIGGYRFSCPPKMEHPILYKTAGDRCVNARLLLKKVTVRLQFDLKANAYMQQPIRNSRDVGALIRDRRRSAGLSQQGLADAIGASRLWVNQVERGKPRAELGLVLKSLEVLAIQLVATERDDMTGGPDIDAIVERARRRRP